MCAELRFNALKLIYRGAGREDADRQLAAFEAAWNGKYRSGGQLWRRHWEQVVPFFAFPPEIRKVIYTTNAVESLNMTLRKVIKTRGSLLLPRHVQRGFLGVGELGETDSDGEQAGVCDAGNCA
jgi:transposase-like protein